MMPRKSPFSFAFQNSFVHIKIKISENNENIEDYASQNHEMLNTMEATTDFLFQTVLLFFSKTFGKKNQTIVKKF